MHVCVGVHARANVCVCVRLRACVWAQAVQQGCAEQRTLNGSDEARSRSRARVERISTDALGVVIRILDPATHGRIAIDAYVDFLFNTSAKQSPAAAKCLKMPSPNANPNPLQSPPIPSPNANPLSHVPMPSPNATHVVSIDSRRHSPSTGHSFTKSCTPPTATHVAKTHKLGANGLFAVGASASRKTLDPWARQNELDNVIVPVLCCDVLDELQCVR